MSRLPKLTILDKLTVLPLGASLVILVEPSSSMLCPDLGRAASTEASNLRVSRFRQGAGGLRGAPSMSLADGHTAKRPRPRMWCPCDPHAQVEKSNGIYDARRYFLRKPDGGDMHVALKLNTFRGSASAKAGGLASHSSKQARRVGKGTISPCPSWQAG